MAYDDPSKHRRKSIRYDGYDYTSAGGYFVTICVRWGRCLLGEVKNQETRLSGAGLIVDGVWRSMNKHFPTITLDEFKIMPNHVHFIMWLNPVRLPVGVSF